MFWTVLPIPAISAGVQRKASHRDSSSPVHFGVGATQAPPPVPVHASVPMNQVGVRSEHKVLIGHARRPGSSRATRMMARQKSRSRLAAAVMATVLSPMRRHLYRLYTNDRPMGMAMAYQHNSPASVSMSARIALLAPGLITLNK